METLTRKPFQGVCNIVRFNWHYYVLLFLFMSVMEYFMMYVHEPWHMLLQILLVLSFVMVFISLVVSYYIYDYSSFYSLDWMADLHIQPGNRVANIHAGFDETSAIITAKYPGIQLSVYDFYDPKKNTELSIQRAGKAYPASPGTRKINASDPVFPQKELDYILLIFAAHEIRKKAERELFFKTLGAALKKEGRILVVEHSRDGFNGLAFSVGFLHFFSPRSWTRIFMHASLRIESRKKVNPFVTMYILAPYGATA